MDETNSSKGSAARARRRRRNQRDQGVSCQTAAAATADFLGGPGLLHTLDLSADQEAATTGHLPDRARWTFANSRRTTRRHKKRCPTRFDANPVQQPASRRPGPAGAPIQDRPHRRRLHRRRPGAPRPRAGPDPEDRPRIHTGMKRLRTQMHALLGDTGTSTELDHSRSPRRCRTVRAKVQSTAQGGQYLGRRPRVFQSTR